MKKLSLLISLFALISFSYADTPPSVISITSPADGSYISKAVTIEAELTQIPNVRSVKFYIDNQLVGEDTTQPYQYTWDTTTYSDGQHTIYASALQAPERPDLPEQQPGLPLDSPKVTVTVDNTPPNLSIMNPQESSFMTGTITAEADVTDNIGISKVEFAIDSNLVSEFTQPPYAYQFDTTQAQDGNHTFLVTAYDLANNKTTKSVIFTVDNSSPSTPLVTDDGAYFTQNTIHASWFSQDLHSGIIEYYFSIGTAKGSQDKYNWTPVGTATEITRGIVLTQGETYYVNVKAKNGAGLFSEVGSSDGIIFDSKPPTGGNIKINDDAQYATSPEVTLSLSAHDSVSGLDKVALSNDGINYSAPLGYAPSMSWTLSQGEGTKYVFVKFIDVAGNWSPAVSDTITLDTIPPQVTITSPADGSETNLQLVTVSGILDDEFTWVEVNGVRAEMGRFKFIARGIVLTPGQNTITATVTDLAGNSSSTSITVTYSPYGLTAWIKTPMWISYEPWGQIAGQGYFVIEWNQILNVHQYLIFRDDGELLTTVWNTGNEAMLSGSSAGIYDPRYPEGANAFWRIWPEFLRVWGSHGYYVVAQMTDGSRIYSNMAYMPKYSLDMGGQIPQGKTTTVAEPINVATGNMFTSQTDILVPAREIPLELSRTYNSQDDFDGQFGYGWRSNYDIILEEDINGDVLEVDEKGIRTYYIRNPDGTYTTSAGKYSQLTRNPNGTYTIIRKHGRKLYFEHSGRLTKIEERNGNTVNIIRSFDGVISEVNDSSGRKLLFAKNSQGKIAQITDPANRIFRYEYDTEGNLIRTQDPLDNEMFYQYDNNHNIIRQTDANGRSIFYEYDTKDRAYHSWQDGNNNEVRLVFDPANFKTTTTDSLGNVTTYEYINQGLVTKITDAQNNVQIFVWDEKLNKIISIDQNHNGFLNSYDARGNLLVVKDPLGNTTSFAYEPNFDFVSQTTNAQGNLTEYLYDERGNLTQIKDALNNFTNYSYDAQGQLIQVKDANNNVTNFGYDTYGNLNQIIDALNNQTTFTYDIIGNKTQITDVEGNLTKFDYDLLNRLISITYPDNSNATYNYDPVGNLISSTDQNNNVTTYVYDEADRLIKTEDALGNITQYGYDTEGNRLSTTDANSNRTRYEYDSLNRLIKTVFPDNSDETYSYDRAGNLTQKVTRKGDRISLIYDALNRLTEKRYPDGAKIIYTYDALSRLLTVTDFSGTITHIYDALGRLTSVTYPNSMAVSYEYDAVGNKTKLNYPDGTYLTYSYDALNRLKGLSLEGPVPIPNLATFNYDNLSRRTNLTLANGVTTPYSYDSLSRLLSLTNQKPPTTISFFNYTYDAVGNRLTKQSNEGTHNYTYDNIYQLTQVQKPDISTKIYNFDQVGNRTTVEGLSPQGTVPYTTNALNQYTAVGSEIYSYDLNGNLTQKQQGTNTTTYTYDYENRLIAGTVPEQGLFLRFTYDPFGRRIQKEVNGTIQAKYIYDADNIILDLDSNNQIIAKYIYGPSIDEPLALIKGNDIYYYSKDGLGSVVNLTDSNGQVIESYTYDEYGNISAPSQIGNRYLYTGREYDPEINLYYYRARYYDPSIGRFLTKDPIGYKGGINLYTYVKNNPINKIDPFGLKTWIYISAGGGGSLGPLSAFLSVEGGSYFLIDPLTGTYYQFGYFSGGLGLGFGGALQVEGGIFDGPSDPTQISNWSLTVSSFAAAGKGLSGQVTGTSFWGQGEGGGTAGFAGGAGAGISGMLTRSWYLGKGNVLPQSLQKIYQEILREYKKGLKG